MHDSVENDSRLIDRDPLNFFSLAFILCHWRMIEAKLGLGF